MKLHGTVVKSRCIAVKSRLTAVKLHDSTAKLRRTAAGEVRQASCLMPPAQATPKGLLRWHHAIDYINLVFAFLHKKTANSFARIITCKKCPELFARI